MTSADLFVSDFATLPDLVRCHAQERPEAIAVVDPDMRINWHDLDALVNRIAARLQSDHSRGLYGN